MLSKPELAKAVYDRCSLEGEFLLRSGVVSNVYFDKYLFEADPAMLLDITLHLKDAIPEGIDALAGLEMGGIPIATLLAQHSGHPVLFVRKEAKEYGTCKIAEGGDIAGKKLLIVEDVVTSGGAILDGVAQLRERGAIVEDVVCVINREASGVDNLKEAGLSLHALFTRTELEAAGA